MRKILIIGQAPPAVKQTLPYDTTMLYDILSWVGIDKDRAQEMFQFDALVDKFPGFDSRGGHLKPSKDQICEYYSRSLRISIDMADKIILLGAPARGFLRPDLINYGIRGKYLYLPHPSRRNYNLIMGKKEEITTLLRSFLGT
jgi:uracil-DNA glycosylase